MDLESKQKVQSHESCFISSSGKLVQAATITWDSTTVGDQLLVPAGEPLRTIALKPATNTNDATVILSHPQLHLYLASLSPDQHWVAFTGESENHPPHIFIAPFRGATPVPPAEWIEFGNGDYPRWSPAGHLLFLNSTNPGLPVLMRQNWDAPTSRTIGQPQAIRQFAAASAAVRNLPPGSFRIAASRKRIAFTAASAQGKIFQASEISETFLSQFSLKNPINSIGGFFMKKMKNAIIMMGLSLASSQAATIYDLKTDYSNVSNPNGVWSFTQGTTALTKFNPPFSGCCGDNFQLVAGNGFWGITGPTSFFPDSFVEKVTGNGSVTGSYTNNDFLSGDVIVHSTNPGNGAAIFFNWVAPSAGTIDSYSGGVWYAHSPVSRSNTFDVIFNGGASLNTGVVGPAQNRSNQVAFSSAGLINVSAGDKLVLRLTPTTGQPFGTVSGLNFTVNFTPTSAPTPEPATAGLVGAAIAGLIALRRRR